MQPFWRFAFSGLFYSHTPIRSSGAIVPDVSSFWFADKVKYYSYFSREYRH